LFESQEWAENRAIQVHYCDQFSTPEPHGRAYRGAVFAVRRGTDFGTAGGILHFDVWESAQIQLDFASRQARAVADQTKEVNERFAKGRRRWRTPLLNQREGKPRPHEMRPLTL
jgi:hypothetical protein